MTYITLFFSLINEYTALPVVVIFLSTAFFFTYLTRCGQIRYFSYFLKLITGGISRTHDKKNSITPIHALITAMSTTIGMGNIVGPSIAIMIGGPGALFWLLLYIFFGSSIKFVEVSYAVATKTKNTEGEIIGGPMRYLSLVSPNLALFYTILIIPLLLIWSGLQSNTFAQILAIDGVPPLITGICLALYLCFVLLGGIQSVSKIANKLFPIMFFSYIIASFVILLRAPLSFFDVFSLIKNHVFSPFAIAGGLSTISLIQSMQTGILRGIFISESGIGTSAIAHSFADTKNPFDQGVLAMCASVADLFLCALSGLIALKTGIFQEGVLRSTLVYEAFIRHSPLWGKYILQLSATLFVLTTIVGNSFNALQNFNVLTKYKFTKLFILCVSFIVIYGATLPMLFLLQLSDLLLILVAIPHVLGLIYLAVKKGYVKKEEKI